MKTRISLASHDPTELSVQLPSGESIPYALFESCVGCFERRLPMTVITAQGERISVSTFDEVLRLNEGRPGNQVRLPNGATLSASTFRSVIQGLLEDTIEFSHSYARAERVLKPTVILPCGEQLPYTEYETIVNSYEKRRPMRVVTPKGVREFLGLTELIIVTQNRPYDLVVLDDGDVVSSKTFRDVVSSRYKKDAFLLLPSGTTCPLDTDKVFSLSHLPSGMGNDSFVSLPNGEVISQSACASILRSESDKLPKIVIDSHGQTVRVNTLPEILTVTQTHPGGLIELKDGTIVTPSAYESAVSISDGSSRHLLKNVSDPNCDPRSTGELSIIIYGGLELPYKLYESILDTFFHTKEFFVTVSESTVPVKSLLDLINMTHGNPNDVITLPNGMHVKSMTFRGVINEHLQNDIFLRIPTGKIVPLAKGKDFLSTARSAKISDKHPSSKEGSVTLISGERIPFHLYELIICSSLGDQPIRVLTPKGEILIAKTLPELLEITSGHPDYLIRLPGGILVTADTYSNAVISRRENAEAIRRICRCGTDIVFSSESALAQASVHLPTKEKIPYPVYESIIESYLTRTPVQTSTSPSEYVSLYPLVELMLVTKHQPSSLVHFTNGNVTTAQTYRDAVIAFTQGGAKLLYPSGLIETLGPCSLTVVAFPPEETGLNAPDNCKFVRVAVPGRGVQFILADGSWDSARYCRVECGEGNYRYEPVDPKGGLPTYESLVRPDGKIVYVETSHSKSRRPKPQDPPALATDDVNSSGEPRTTDGDPHSKLIPLDHSPLTPVDAPTKSGSRPNLVVEGSSKPHQTDVLQPPLENEPENTTLSNPSQVLVIGGNDEWKTDDVGTDPFSLFKPSGIMTQEKGANINDAKPASASIIGSENNPLIVEEADIGPEAGRAVPTEKEDNSDNLDVHTPQSEYPSGYTSRAEPEQALVEDEGDQKHPVGEGDESIFVHEPSDVLPVEGHSIPENIYQTMDPVFTSAPGPLSLPNDRATESQSTLNVEDGTDLKGRKVLVIDGEGNAHTLDVPEPQGEFPPGDAPKAGPGQVLVIDEDGELHTVDVKNETVILYEPSNIVTFENSVVPKPDSHSLPTEESVILISGERIPAQLYEAIICNSVSGQPISVLASNGTIYTANNATDLYQLTQGHPGDLIKLQDGSAVSVDIYINALNSPQENTEVIKRICGSKTPGLGYFPPQISTSLPADGSKEIQSSPKDIAAANPATSQVLVVDGKGAIHTLDVLEPQGEILPEDAPIAGPGQVLVIDEDGELHTVDVKNESVVLYEPSNVVSFETPKPDSHSLSTEESVVLISGERIPVRLYEGIICSSVSGQPISILALNGTIYTANNATELYQLTQGHPEDLITLQDGSAVSADTYINALKSPQENIEALKKKCGFEPKSAVPLASQSSGTLPSIDGSKETPPSPEAFAETDSATGQVRVITGKGNIDTVDVPETQSGALKTAGLASPFASFDPTLLPIGADVPPTPEVEAGTDLGSSQVRDGDGNSHILDVPQPQCDYLPEDAPKAGPGQIVVTDGNGELHTVDAGDDRIILYEPSNILTQESGMPEPSCHTSPKGETVALISGERIPYQLYEAIVCNSVSGQPISVLSLDGSIHTASTPSEVVHLTEGHPEYLVKLQDGSTVSAYTFLNALSSPQENTEAVKKMSSCNGLENSHVSEGEVGASPEPEIASDLCGKVSSPPPSGSQPAAEMNAQSATSGLLVVDGLGPLPILDFTQPASLYQPEEAPSSETGQAVVMDSEHQSHSIGRPEHAVSVEPFGTEMYETPYEGNGPLSLPAIADPLETALKIDGAASAKEQDGNGLAAVTAVNIGSESEREVPPLSRDSAFADKTKPPTPQSRGESSKAQFLPQLPLNNPTLLTPEGTRRKSVKDNEEGNASRFHEYNGKVENAVPNIESERENTPAAASPIPLYPLGFPAHFVHSPWYGQCPCMRPYFVSPHVDGFHPEETFHESRSPKITKSKKKKKKKKKKQSHNNYEDLPEIRPTYTPIYDDDGELLYFIKSDLLLRGNHIVHDSEAPSDSMDTNHETHIFPSQPNKIVSDDDGNTYVLPLNPDGTIAFDTKSSHLDNLPEDDLDDAMPTTFVFPEMDDFMPPSSDPAYVIVQTPEGYINYVPMCAAPGREIILPSGAKHMLPVFPSRFIEPSVPYHAFTTPDGCVYKVPYGRGYEDDGETSTISVEKIETADGETVEVPVETKKRSDGSITTSVSYSPKGQPNYKTIVDVSGEVYCVPISGTTTHQHPNSKIYKTIIDPEGDEFHVPEGQLKSSSYKTIVDVDGNIYEIPAHIQPVDNLRRAQQRTSPALPDPVPGPPIITEVLPAIYRPEFYVSYFTPVEYALPYYYHARPYYANHFDPVVAHFYTNTAGSVEQHKPSLLPSSMTH